MGSQFGLLLLLAAISTASAEAHPRLVCPDACTDDGDQQQPCGSDCATCACCLVFHLVAPTRPIGLVSLAPPTARPSFTVPAPLISRESNDVFHVPKSPLA